MEDNLKKSMLEDKKRQIEAGKFQDEINSLVAGKTEEEQITALDNEIAKITPAEEES